MGKIKNIDGFTLIEVVISLAILTILIISFLSLFTTGLLGIYGAGDKGIAYSEAQADIESRIGTGDATAADDLVLVFDGVSHNIPGGLVESYRQEQNRSSNLETYIPYVPTIGINPAVKLEGTESPTEIDVTGYYTNFHSSYTSIELFENMGETLLTEITDFSITSETSLTFTMPENLVNANGFYIVRVTTAIPGNNAEISRARYVVEQPGFVTVGNGLLFVSENGSFWYDRPASTMDTFPSFTVLNDVCFGQNRYIAVGNNGQVLRSANQNSWSNLNISANNLNAVIWAAGVEKYYTVGLNGSVYYSDDGLSWSALTLNTSPDLNGICTTDTGFLTLVGAEGNIITISNTGTITYYNVFDTTENLNDVATNYTLYGLNNLFIAVGNNGAIVTSTDGTSWAVYSDLSITENLNSIAYHNDLFVIVGDSGRIIVNNPDGTWSSNLVGDANLNGVFGSGGTFVAVGEDGTIMTSSDASDWTVYDGIITGDLKAIAGK